MIVYRGRLVRDKDILDTISIEIHLEHPYIVLVQYRAAEVMFPEALRFSVIGRRLSICGRRRKQIQ